MTAVFEKQTIAALEQDAFKAHLTERSALMEQAGRAVFCAVKDRVSLPGIKAVVLCGGGNNGGDGYVCARCLAGEGADVTVVTAQPPGSPSCAETARAYTGKVCDREAAASVLSSAQVVVEAVYGTGFHGALPDAIRQLFSAVPATAYRVAVDLPAGLTADENTVADGTFQADTTVTFFGMKRCLVNYPAAAFAGQVRVETLGLPPDYLDRYPRCGFMGTPPVFWPRDRAAHKGTYGTVGALVGHYGMIGAALLCGKAALRSGCGLLKMAVEESIYPTVTLGLPEAVCFPFAPGQTPQGLLAADSLAVGCGLSVGQEPARLVHWLLDSYTGPLVLDADGLNNCVGRIQWLRESKAKLILTPHPGEMARLCATDAATVGSHREQFARQLAGSIHGVTVLKGAYTVITDGERTVYNPTGNPGLATGGSGDVLTGIIAALCAAGYDPFDAARYGVWLHGRAADLAAQTVGEISLLPQDVLEALPQAIRECEASSCGGGSVF